MADFEYYEEDDQGFLTWLGEHPDGYVLNCYNTGKLHTALCKTYRVHGEHMTYKRPKACSTSVKRLLRHAAQKGYDVPERCQQCFG
jgi:hypothetical protein